MLYGLEGDLILNDKFTNSVLIAVESGKACYTERHIPILRNKKQLVKNLKRFMDQKEKHEDGNALSNTLEVKASEIISGVRQFLKDYQKKGGADQT